MSNLALVARNPGPILGLSILAAWIGCVAVGVVAPVPSSAVVLAPLLILVQCWLSVGLFIVAHDCMHGSFAPGRKQLNRRVGQACLLLYAGMSYDRLLPKHFQHHVHSGTARDPDFHHLAPVRPWPWFGVFFRTYFGWREMLNIAAVVMVCVVLLHVSPTRLMLFWALPAIIASCQLFYFGTYLPHRHQTTQFEDRHNARSSAYSWLVSLLTCFHFGYHLEHHLSPATPWWGLPAFRRARSKSV